MKDKTMDESTASSNNFSVRIGGEHGPVLEKQIQAFSFNTVAKIIQIDFYYPARAEEFFQAHQATANAKSVCITLEVTRDDGTVAWGHTFNCEPMNSWTKFNYQAKKERYPECFLSFKYD